MEDVFPGMNGPSDGNNQGLGGLLCHRFSRGPEQVIEKRSLGVKRTSAVVKEQVGESWLSHVSVLGEERTC
jgi:hypothetical protein